MGKTRIIGIVLALGAALAAFVVAKSFMGKAPEVVEAPQAKKAEILVVAKDLQMGDKLAAGSLVWREWPEDAITSSMIKRADHATAKEDMESGRARVALYEGEPLIERKIIAADKPGFMSAMLPKGMRAISVGISEQSGAGGFILPNDRVDVILTKKVPDTTSGQVVPASETVLRNVRVLAINQTFRHETGPDGDQVTVSGGKTATLELTDQQSELIVRVEQTPTGVLSLALRSIAENDGKKLSEIAPEISPDFNNTSETLVVRYGVEKYTANK